MDDDIMLNVVTNLSKSKVNQNNQANQSVQKKMNKTDIKRIKYSEKMKRRGLSLKKNRKQNTSQNTLFKGNTSTQKMGALYKMEVKQQPEVKLQQRQERRPRKQRSQRRPTSQQNRQTRTLKNFTPQSIKQVLVPQLLAEQQLKQNNIDNNSLENFKLQPKLKSSLEKANITKLTEIQQKCYQPLLSKIDSVIKASTGSGKTLAYLIPLINRIIVNKTITKREDGTCILVICPTRELCVQAQKEATRCLKRCPFIIPGCLFGGEETNHQKSRLRKGTNLLFCTPGRVLYHLQQTQCFKLNNLQAIVFEQADRTLDMGFETTIHKILKILKQKISLSEIHKVLVSAHFNSKVSDLLEQIQMNQAKFIGFQNMEGQMKLSNLKQNKDMEINTSVQLKQQYVLVSQEQKIPLMLAYLGVLTKVKALIFASTIDEVEYFDYLFNNLKYRDSNGNQTQIKFQKRPVFKIHGDLDQKLRSKTYLEFRQSKEAILISTQVASRGLDFPDLSHIILYDVPPTITDYGNRVGRSARFNQTGVSLLMLHYLESDYAQKIRYYAPNLQVIQKDIIYESFEKILKSMNIGDSSLHYIEGLVRSAVKNDDEKYMVARKAYVSMLRAYARLPDKNIFAVKKLNLKLLARSFGLNNAQADKSYNPKAKNSHLEAIRKKRKVEDVRKLQFSQYL